MTQGTVIAPLKRLTARRALLVARKYCTRDCYSYHASWKLLTAIRLKGHPCWHKSFYRHVVLRSASRLGSTPTILICGSADETMLALLHTLGPQASGSVTLLDRCLTPLYLNRAYSNAVGTRLRVVQGRIEAMPFPDDAFDLVLTDGLFTITADDGSIDVFLSEIRRVLRPGGVFFYTTRVTKSSKPLLLALFERALRASVALGWRGSIHDRITLAWHEVLSEPPFHPLTAATEVRHLFKDFSTVEISLQAGPPTRWLSLHPVFLTRYVKYRLAIVAVK